MSKPVRHQRVWVRIVIALTVVICAVGFGIVHGIPPSGTAMAGCFQRGGYNPPQCTSASPTPTTSKSADTSTGSRPADSGINACQNQGAMPTSLGLPTATCRASQGPNTPPDSGVTACQNQGAMPIAIGLQPTTCRASQGPNTPPDSGVNACQNQNAMANSLGLQPAVCPPSARD